MTMDWAAGIFEGEGCINIRPEASRRPNPSVRLVVGMTDRDVIERLHEVVGCGTVTEKHPPSIQEWKKQWVWKTAHRDEVRRLLEAWLPFFGERRAAKARDALAVLDEIEEKRNRVCWCGKPFRAERMTKYACCEKHQLQWAAQRRRLEAA